MLDDFKSNYKVAYRILNNDLKKNRCSHAYLFETNGNLDKNDIVMSFAKSLLCPYNYTNLEKCIDCYQCKNIDEHNYLEIKIIEPDGMWIKKEQLLDLQEEFKTKSITGNKKVYIIHNAEKMNASAANSLLKFLEEPEENIIAILSTDNIHQLLDTIVSRCQIITLNNNHFSDKKQIQNVLSNQYEKEKLEEIIDNTIEFTNYLENNGVNTLLYTKRLFFDKFEDKNDIVTFFEIMIFYYKDIIHLKLNKQPDFFEQDSMKDIVKYNTITTLNHKINIIMEAKDKMKVNANVNLLIDKLIIDIGGV